MMKDLSDKKVSKKWKSYITGIITSNFTSFNKIDKYFRHNISESSSKAIQENWIRILGIDYEIISLNLCKRDQSLGVALEGRNEIARNTQEVVQHHFFKVILPGHCIGDTGKFMVKDEILEVNGLKVVGLSTKEALHTLRKVTNYFQIVVARSIIHNYDLASDYGGSEDNINSPISFYDMDDDESSRNGTLRSNVSNYSTTSRDFGSSVSFGGMIDGQHETVTDYLRNIIGWRGPIVIELRKENSPFGVALEEIRNPLQSSMIIVFKYVVPEMTAGKDGRLHAGDRLLQVNGKSVEGVHFRQVCKWIKSAPRGRLILYICKPHFAAISYDASNPAIDDKYYFNTIRDMDKLPKLSEETDGECRRLPAVPEYMETHITLKRKENKLGIFLDIVEEGKNGARIKKLANGIAKDDGRLHEGDFITKINEISLKVDEKSKLDVCLKQIAADKRNYNISYITAEDVRLHNSKYATVSSVKNGLPQVSQIYPDSADIRLTQPLNDCNSDKVRNPKFSFETFDIAIKINNEIGLGLVLSPSLKDPKRFISITDIHDNSLCGKSGLLKINDEILKVNDFDFENISINEAGQFLKRAHKSENELRFQVRRLTCFDNVSVDPIIEKLTQFPDIYRCVMKRGPNGFGFSLLELDSNNGVIVDKIDLNKVCSLKPGERFVMINKCTVITCAKLNVVQMVKNSAKNLDLIIETPKYREFQVQISKDSSMSLGLNIAGGRDTKFPIPLIESLIPNKTSKFSEELVPYDLIIEVDGINVIQQNHNEIIQIFRSTGRETNFKILRKIPYIKRKLFLNTEIPDFLRSYLQEVQYSVTLNKPVDSITSFGINFTDIVIVDEKNNFKVISRYKAVLLIEKNSLAEKYAPQIKEFDYLISIDGVSVNDCDLLCEDIKETIDKHNRVNLIFSKDIPYNLPEVKDHDSPIVLSRSNISQLESSSEENLSVHSNSQPLTTIAIDLVNNDTKNTENGIVDVDKLVDNEERIEAKSDKKDQEFDNLNSIPLQIEKNDPDADENTEDNINTQSFPLVTCDLINDDTNNTANCTVDVDKLTDNEGRCETINDEDLEVDNSNEIPVEIEKNNSDVDLVNDDTSNAVKCTVDVDILTDNEGRSETINDEDLEVGNSNPIPVETQRNYPDVEEFTGDKIKNIENYSAENSLNISTGDQVSEEIKSDNPEMDYEEIPGLPINISNVIIKRIPNIEWGFQLYGGLEGGPKGESLPVFVIGVERNTCNWPEDQEEPFLKNGQQLIKLNGQSLSALKISTVEAMINEAHNELKFKVVSLK